MTNTYIQMYLSSAPGASWDFGSRSIQSLFQGQIYKFANTGLRPATWESFSSNLLNLESKIGMSWQKQNSYLVINTWAHLFCIKKEHHTKYQVDVHMAHDHKCNCSNHWNQFYIAYYLLFVLFDRYLSNTRCWFIEYCRPSIIHGVIILVKHLITMSLCLCAHCHMVHIFMYTLTCYLPVYPSMHYISNQNCKSETGNDVVFYMNIYIYIYIYPVMVRLIWLLVLIVTTKPIQVV